MGKHPDLGASERAKNARTKFSCSYEFDGTRWMIEVWASTWEEAEMKLRAVGTGSVDGVVVGEWPAGDGEVWSG